MRRCASIIAALAATLLSAATVHAQTAEEFYRGKRLDLVICTTPGGGIDALGRLFAKTMTRFLPGNPTITARNMPGAGGLEGANYIYNVAPKDGTVFALLLQGVAFLPLFGEKQARFDATKFTWVGNANSETGIYFVWNSSPVHTIADLAAREVPSAATDGGSATAFNYRVLNDLLGTKVKIITGYPGSNESFMALERGEVEGFFAVWSTLKTRGTLMRDGLVRPIVQIALEKAPDLPNVPLAAEFVKSDADRQALELAVAPGFLGKPFVAPPGLPADRAKALQDAFAATAKDKSFLEDVAKAGLEVAQHQSGEEALALLKHFYQAPPEAIARVSAITKGN